MIDPRVYEGEVVWFRVGYNYGFIAWEKDGVKQTDIFAHFSDIEMEGFKLLKSSQKVSFSIGLNNSGKPKAINIKVIS